MSLPDGKNMLPPGTNFCQCAACGEYFTTPAAFDMHRRWGEDKKTRLCVSPMRLVTKSGAPRLVKNAKGYWSRPGSFRK